MVLGIDGSPHSRRAVAFLARLTPAAGGRVTAVQVVEPVRAPSLALLPRSVRGRIAGGLAQRREADRATAQRTLDAAARILERTSWRVCTVLREGIPVTELLDVVQSEKADLLVLGGRGTGRLEGLLLGSTAEGALKRSPVPVLVVK